MNWELKRQISTRMKVSVILLNGESEEIVLEGHEKNGRHLLQRVFTLLELHNNTQYFGLSYRDKEDGDLSWLTESDQLSSVLGKVKILQFGVRFYPRRPEDDIFDAKALELFSLHMKELLIKGELACDVPLHAYLDGLLIQGKLGNFTPGKHKTGYLKNIRGIEICAPTYLNSNGDVRESIYLRQVTINHRKNLGIQPAEAYQMYIARARTLPYFGFSLFLAKMKDKSVVTLGLSERGLTLFRNRVVDRLEHPKETEFFNWSGLRYCERSRGKVLLGFEANDEKLKEFNLKIKSKNSFCGAERLRKEIFGYREVFAKKDSEFFHSKRLAKKNDGFPLIDDRMAKKGGGSVHFVRLNSFGDAIRRSFSMKKNLRARMKRGSEGDITRDSQFMDHTVLSSQNTTNITEITQIS